MRRNGHAVRGPQAVVLDVGETLADETRAWGVWADWLGVPRLTFFGALGAIIARSGGHHEVFELFRPGIDVEAEARRLGVAGRSDLVPLDHLSPGALAGPQELDADGAPTGVAGQHPAQGRAGRAARGARPGGGGGGGCVGPG